MKRIFVLFVALMGFGASAHAEGWSCDCYVKQEEQTWIMDGDTENEAKEACREVGGEVKSCLPRGRGDRLPQIFGESVRVPRNPGGVDVCRDFIAYHKKIDSLDITLKGRTPEDMRFMYQGSVVGTMFYNDDGSEAAVCTVL